jgi:DNA-directed RNA polymerase subunit RPC12/RpoP
MPKIKIDGYSCFRCNHKWVPREDNEKPLVCPRCKSPYWDKERKNGQ